MVPTRPSRVVGRLRPHCPAGPAGRWRSFIPRIRAPARSPCLCQGPAVGRGSRASVLLPCRLVRGPGSLWDRGRPVRRPAGWWWRRWGHRGRLCRDLGLEMRTILEVRKAGGRAGCSRVRVSFRKIRIKVRAPEWEGEKQRGKGRLSFSTFFSPSPPFFLSARLFSVCPSLAVPDSVLPHLREPCDRGALVGPTAETLALPGHSMCLLANLLEPVSLWHPCQHF